MMHDLHRGLTIMHDDVFCGSSRLEITDLKYSTLGEKKHHIRYLRYRIISTVQSLDIARSCRIILVKSMPYPINQLSQVSYQML